MARGMALAGVDPSELAPPPPAKKPKGFKENVSNIWYHYRVLIIGICVALFLVGTLVYQTVTKDPADYQVVFVTKEALYPQEVEALKSFLSLGAEDLDGDGKIEIEIENLLPGFQSDAAPDIGHSDNQKLTTYIASGERMLFAFDAESYDGFVETIANITDEGYTFFGEFETASSGYDPDEHFWSWEGDPRLESFGLEELPEMRFGVRTPTGTAKADELYEQSKTLLEKLTGTAE